MNDVLNGPINKYYKRPTPNHSNLHRDPRSGAPSIDEEGTSNKTPVNRNVQLGPSAQHEAFVHRHNKNHVNYTAFMESMG